MPSRAPRFPKSRPSRTRQRQETEKKNTFPSEYSFAICLISLAFLTLCTVKGGEKNTPPPTPPPPLLCPYSIDTDAVHLPNFRIFMQSDSFQQANDSDHLDVSFFFFFFYKYNYTFE